MKRIIVTLFLVALVAGNAHGWWFKGKENPGTPAKGPRVTKRYHLHIPDKKSEQELLNLFQTKRNFGEEVKVLQRLNAEKKKQYAVVQKSLMDEFGVLPEIKYYYDNKKMIIFKLTPKGEAVTDPEGKIAVGAEKQGSFEQEEHKALKGKREEQRFVDLLKAKKRFHDQLQAIQEMLVGKQKALDNVTNLMAAKFSMKPGRYYDYDRTTMKLYEIGPATAPAPRK